MKIFKQEITAYQQMLSSQEICAAKVYAFLWTYNLTKPGLSIYSRGSWHIFKSKL